MRNRAGSVLLVVSAVSAFASLLLLHVRPAGLDFALPLVLSLALSIATIAVGATRRSTVVGASGGIALVGVLTLSGWIWRSQYALYPNDAVRACAGALGPGVAGPHVGSRRSVLPPGLFCSSADGREVLITTPATVVGWTLVLVAIAMAFILAIALARRYETRGPMGEPSRA